MINKLKEDKGYIEGTPEKRNILNFKFQILYFFYS